MQQSANVSDLKTHLLNAELYQEEAVPDDFLASVKKMGILNPLLILKDGTIVSGHRRYWAAKVLKLMRVPVCFCHLDDPLDIAEAIIESNRQREKTFSQKMREAEMLEEIEATRARERQGTSAVGVYGGKPLVEGFSTSGFGKTRDKVAEKVGIGSGRQYDKAKGVWLAAQEGDEIAVEQIGKLDAGEITIHKALQTIRHSQESKCPHVARSTGENEWYTPQEYINAARKVMGNIDLDPASADEANTIIQATEYYTPENDGLSKGWQGNVWMNPPYAQPLIGQFATKLVKHVRAGDVPEAIILVNNATETSWFIELIGVASAICFPQGRVKFWHPDGRIAAPLQGQAIIYIGTNTDTFIAEFRGFGWIATIALTAN